MNSRKITLTMMLFYLVVLTWVIVFKMQFSLSELGYMRNINLIPFGEPVITNGTVDYGEIRGNILAFIPFGIFLQILIEEKAMWIKILPILLTSLLFETVQFILAVGASDITDLIMNTLGGIIGIAAACGVSKCCPKKWIGILNICSIIGAAILVGFLGLLVVYNL